MARFFLQNRIITAIACKEIFQILNNNVRDNKKKKTKYFTIIIKKYIKAILLNCILKFAKIYYILRLVSLFVTYSEQT